MPAAAQEPARVAIVGGGIAGLAAGYRLQELARDRRVRLEIMVLEAAQRLGGSIATERTDGFVIESGPDSFISEKPWALSLCQRLDLGDRLVGTRDEHRRTFIVHDGVLHPLPDGFLLLAPTQFWPLVTSRLFSWPGKLRMALDLVLPRGTSNEDESLGAFVTRRLGREALERVAQPLVGGIYTADPDTLSLAATMPRFLQLEREQRSLILAMVRQGRRAQQRQATRGSAPGQESGARWSLFVSFDDGMQRLVDTIAGRLPAGAVRLGTAVSAVMPAGGAGGWRLALADGVGVEVDGVILATPAHQTARLVADLDAGLAATFGTIDYASSATVSLAYRRADIAHPLDGFGFVVPLIERRPIIACTFSSVKYPGRAPADHVLMRCFAGGALQASVADLDDDALTRAVRSELAELLGITAEPALLRIHRHRRAMPQYRVGHLGWMASIDTQLGAHRGLAVAGNAYRGVGIPDCVHSGEMAAETVMAAVARS